MRPRRTPPVVERNGFGWPGPPAPMLWPGPFSQRPLLPTPPLPPQARPPFPFPFPFPGPPPFLPFDRMAMPLLMRPPFPHMPPSPPINPPTFAPRSAPVRGPPPTAPPRAPPRDANPKRKQRRLQRRKQRKKARAAAATPSQNEAEEEAAAADPHSTVAHQEEGGAILATQEAPTCEGAQIEEAEEGEEGHEGEEGELIEIDGEIFQITHEDLANKPPWSPTPSHIEMLSNTSWWEEAIRLAYEFHNPPAPSPSQE